MGAQEGAVYYLGDGVSGLVMREGRHSRKGHVFTLTLACYLILGISFIVAFGEHIKKDVGSLINEN